MGAATNALRTTAPIVTQAFISAHHKRANSVARRMAMPVMTPEMMAILQARRPYQTRGPSGNMDDGKDPEPIVRGPPIRPPVDGKPPEPVATPATDPGIRAANRAQRMRAYMEANGMSAMRYGANNVRRGNVSVGSDGPGYVQPGASPAPSTTMTAGGSLTSGNTVTSGGGGVQQGGSLTTPATTASGGNRPTAQQIIAMQRWQNPVEDQNKPWAPRSGAGGGGGI